MSVSRSRPDHFREARSPALPPWHERRRHSRSLLVLLVVAAVAMVAACQQTGGQQGGGAQGSPAGGAAATKRLSIATGGTGGVYYPLGGGIAKEITENVKGVEATAEVTSASVDNMKLIGTGDADLALVLGDTASDAVKGQGPFQGQAVDACALGVLYTNFTQVVTSRDTGITSVGQLKGKRVSLGSPGSGTEVIALRVLEVAGINPDTDIKRTGLGVAESVDGLRDRTIDAFFWSGGLPTGAIVDYATSGRIVLIPTGEYARPLQAKYGEFYRETQIAARTYQGQDQPVSSVGVPNVLVVSKKMDEELQRQITAVVFEQKEDLVKVHPEAKNINKATASQVGFMDLCPGAKRYYEGG